MVNGRPDKKRLGYDSQADKLLRARGIVEQRFEKNAGGELLPRLILFDGISVEVLPEGTPVTAPPLSVRHER